MGDQVAWLQPGLECRRACVNLLDVNIAFTVANCDAQPAKTFPPGTGISGLRGCCVTGVTVEFGQCTAEKLRQHQLMVLFSELGGVVAGFLQGVGYHGRPGIMIFICGRLPFTKDPVFIGNGDLAGLVVYGQQGIGIRERF